MAPAAATLILAVYAYLFHLTLLSPERPDSLGHWWIARKPGRTDERNTALRYPPQPQRITPGTCYLSGKSTQSVYGFALQPLTDSTRHCTLALMSLPVLDADKWIKLG